MDFKLKEVVEESIIYFYDHVLSPNEYTDDVLEELDHVYTQAAKADEYEAKEKALDAVKELINAHERAMEEESGLGYLFLLDLKGIMKYAESGDRDV